MEFSALLVPLALGLDLARPAFLVRIDEVLDHLALLHVSDLLLGTRNRFWRNIVFDKIGIVWAGSGAVDAKLPQGSENCVEFRPPGSISGTPISNCLCRLSVICSSLSINWRISSRWDDMLSPERVSGQTPPPLSLS